MKLLLSSVFTLSACALIAQTTASNGVVVHEALGVEGKVVQQAAPTSERIPISQWSLPACEDAVNILNNKLMLVPDEEKPFYQEQLNEVNKRITELKSTKG